MVQGRRRALEWLAAAAQDPTECAWRWRRDELGTELLPAGRIWDVLILPLRPGLLALSGLLRGCDSPGPALADFVRGQVGFFVPPASMAHWVGTGAHLAAKGSWVVVPLPGRRVHGLEWLLPPDGRGALNDPQALEAALHAAAWYPGRAVG